MAREAKKDFFISYRGVDRRWALWIDCVLKEAGYTTMIQAVDFLAGGNLILKMDEGLKTCRYTMPVYTPRYFESPFTQAEWSAALKHQIETGEDRLLPVRVEKCSIEGLLSGIAYVDLCGLDETAAREKLLAEIARKEKKPSPAVVFPGKAEEAPAARPPFPPNLPPVWNVPHLRNPNFTGREETLKNLRDILSSGDTAALTALHGLGGVGKTQIALEYVYRFASDYSLVWWLPSEEPAALSSTYAALAVELGLAPADAPIKDVLPLLRKHLEHNGGWLLVFDNAENPSAIDAYIPRAAAGRVIVTSRHDTWPPARAIDVDIFQRPESIDFLLRRARSTDRDGANAVADALGDLPLALEQAAAYVTETAVSFKKYLEYFGKRKRGLLKSGLARQDYKDTVWTTWQVSIDAAKSESRAAPDLMNLIAFLGPDSIPRTLIPEAPKHLPKRLAAQVADPLRFDNLIAALKCYSLVKCEAESFCVHRLVQSVLRDRLSPKEQKRWATAAVQIVNEALPDDCSDVRTWPTVAPLLPHGAAAAEHAESLGCVADATAYVLNQLALYLQARADYTPAKDYLERALRIDETAFGPDHPNVARDVNNLGGVLQDLGDLNGARKLFERALRIDETASGPDHPKVAIRVNNLGAVLQDLGDLAGAKKLFERALRIVTNSLGENHPHTILVRANLDSLGK